MAAAGLGDRRSSPCGGPWPRDRWRGAAPGASPTRPPPSGGPWPPRPPSARAAAASGTACSPPPPHSTAAAPVGAEDHAAFPAAPLHWRPWQQPRVVLLSVNTLSCTGAAGAAPTFGRFCNTEMSAARFLQASQKPYSPACTPPPLPPGFLWPTLPAPKVRAWKRWLHRQCARSRAPSEAAICKCSAADLPQHGWTRRGQRHGGAALQRTHHDERGVGVAEPGDGALRVRPQPLQLWIRGQHVPASARQPLRPLALAGTRGPGRMSWGT